MTGSSPARSRRIRTVNIADNVAAVRGGPGGVVYMESTTPLEPYPVRLTDRLEHWAVAAPDRVFLAQRPAPAPGQPADTVTGWRTVTFAAALEQVRRLAQGLLDRRLSRDRTVVILSGNSIEHGLLALAAMYVGVPYAPIAPAYSLQAAEFGTLRQVFDRMKPGLVFAAEGALFERALKDTLPPGTELVVSTSAPAALPSTAFADLQAPPTAAVDAARDRVDGDTVAKVLFTSGSTGRPKGVINTQRMLCSNQVMIRSRAPLPRRRAAGAVLLAALEPHRRRQPQLRHRAAQRRHVLHRRGQADAAALRHHAAQPARGAGGGALHRAAHLRDAAAAPAPRPGAARDVLPQPEAVSSTRRPASASASGTSCATWPWTPAARNCSS